MNQLSIFDTDTQDTHNFNSVKDVRTDKQEKKTVAYDVGATISGARKHLVKRKMNFLDNPNKADLHAFEDEDVVTAAEVITRDTFFNWFSFNDCRERGVEPMAAKAMQLLIHRMPKTPADNRESRLKYMNACLYISELFKNITTWISFQEAESEISQMLYYEAQIDYLDNKVKAINEMISAEKDPDTLEKLENQRAEYHKTYGIVKKSNAVSLSSLDNSFRKFFRDRSSRSSAYKAIGNHSTWDTLIKEPGISTDKSVKVKRKPVWERELPERPDRFGGKIIKIESPEELINHFNFKAVEFGHYLDDEKGREHLFRSAEAFTDLIALLKIPSHSISLGGELSISFGSRGRGSANGHYEPANKVINLTKERGSLGILAHEFFHALDHYLYNYSYDFKNGKYGFLSDKVYGSNLPLEIQHAVDELMDVIKEGNAPAYIDVSKCKGTYRFNRVFKRRYQDFNGELQDFMDEVIEEYDERINNLLSFYVNKSDREAYLSKNERKRKMHIKKHAEALAQYHQEITGEELTRIPYSSDRSLYYQTAIDLDKGKVKYWASNVELTARAFEGFILDELTQIGWVSDYLVCGARDPIFPQGEERQKINLAMGNFIKAIHPILSGKDLSK
ncbi:LPD1 domain-containing protein [Bacillus cihuensis]|uniref:LPD1 domain-containing protein n=1 Tax=Bacillus cihuensis TaxID=1208599 RepID=UPI00040FB748|nr:LPD1 domain-containing protein [Bacillus cihuensis]